MDYFAFAAEMAKAQFDPYRKAVEARKHVHTCVNGSCERSFECNKTICRGIDEQLCGLCEMSRYSDEMVDWDAVYDERRERERFDANSGG